MENVNQAFSILVTWCNLFISLRTDKMIMLTFDLHHKYNTRKASDRDKE